MCRHFWKWTFLLGLAAPAFGQDQQDSPEDDVVHPQVKEALRNHRKSYRKLNQALGNPAGVANPGIERQIKNLDEMEEDFVAACKRISVDPRAERAAAAMRRSSYKQALRKLALLLTAKPDDPYASYLAGMCAAELGQFEEGAKYFASVLKSEPTSHTARLLSAYCKNAAKHKPPLSDETVLACFEAGLAEATKHVPPPETDDDDDFTARLLASVLSLPDILKDPLLYVLDNEALSGRGPRAMDIDRFVAAAQKSNDTYELFLAWFSTPSDEIAAKIEERLDGPQHATTMKALLFLIEYYGQDALFLQRGDKFEKELAELPARMCRPLWRRCSGRSIASGRTANTGRWPTFWPAWGGSANQSWRENNCESSGSSPPSRTPRRMMGSGSVIDSARGWTGTPNMTRRSRE